MWSEKKKKGLQLEFGRIFAKNIQGKGPDDWMKNVIEVKGAHNKHGTKPGGNGELQRKNGWKNGGRSREKSLQGDWGGHDKVKLPLKKKKPGKGKGGKRDEWGIRGGPKKETFT